MAPTGSLGVVGARVGYSPKTKKENAMSETHTPPPQSAPQGGCGCPSENGSNAVDATHASIISADIDAGTSGIMLKTDVLGSDFADVSVGLGAVDGVVDTVLGLTDTGTGLLDGLLCDIV
jgi:hypothetical protein